MADVESAHRMGLEKIKGITADDTSVKMPSNPGRNFMNSNFRFNEKSLTNRWMNNSIVLMQCIETFSEFFPYGPNKTLARLDDKEHFAKLYTIIRDAIGIDILRLTPTTTQHCEDTLINMRKLWLDNNPKNHTNLLNGISQTNKFFLKVLDRRIWFNKEGLPSTQLRFGLRTDKTFAVRMVTRLVQWREALSDPARLLTKWCSIKCDILPADAWTDDLEKMANDFAKKFNKPAPKFPNPNIPASILVLSDDDEPSEELTDTPKTKMLKDITTRMDRMERDLAKVDNSLDKGFTKQDQGFAKVETDLHQVNEVADALKSFRLAWDNDSKSEDAFVRTHKNPRLK